MDVKYIVELNEEQEYALNRMRDQADPEDKLKWIKVIKELETVKPEIKFQEKWYQKLDPNVILTSVVATGQIILIMKGESVGDYFNGRLQNFMTKVKH